MENFRERLQCVGTIFDILHLKTDSIPARAMQMSLQQAENPSSYFTEEQKVEKDVFRKFSIPDFPVIFIVKDNIEQHQHDHRLVPKHWMTVLEYLQVETKSLIVRDWHELNHGAKKTRVNFTIP